jgi:predicted TIM-barrel fold metal-dependent hydrolase
MKTFVKLARRHHLVISAHSSEPVGHSYPGKGMATPGVLFNFIGSLDDLPVVCAHWGGGLPFYTLMPEVRTALENVYFDTAASPFLCREEVFPQVLNLVGMDRVLFGSDFPVMPASRLLAQIDSAGIPEESKQAVLSGNARRLLGL